MSTYKRETKHPVTGEWKDAVWIDDCFGSHNYGVQFDGEDDIYDVRGYDLEIRDNTITNTPQSTMEMPHFASPTDTCTLTRKELGEIAKQEQLALLDAIRGRRIDTVTDDWVHVDAVTISDIDTVAAEFGLTAREGGE